MLHHSDDPSAETFAVTCYLDESGTDLNGPVAVLGGLLLNKANCSDFDAHWANILNHYNIAPPLHMREFGPHGKHGHLYARARRGLFLGLVDVINFHKIISIAATLNHEQFKAYVPEKIPANVSMYGLCFTLCAFQNHRQAEHMEYKERIAFLLEQPSEHAGEIVEAHRAMIKWQESQEFHMGNIEFADKKISALQAADVVAWGVRRRISGKPFHRGFEPILDIFNPEHHLENTWEDKYFLDLTEWAGKEIAKQEGSQ